MLPTVTRSCSSCNKPTMQNKQMLNHAQTTKWPTPWTWQNFRVPWLPTTSCSSLLICLHTTIGCWLIDRIEAAANIGTWDDCCKVWELASILQGPAQSWSDSLETFNIDKDSWNAIKTSFLKSFEQKYSTKIAPTSKTWCQNQERPSYLVFPWTQKLSNDS